uniref:Isoform H of Centrosomin n=1 Tax=Drosophila melanogaster TaxID=7227 RepID=P54623-5|nr:centrosomin, isoform H [Drosophila melanogaster]AFH08050.1 centrosomin, isoform H [Drosophila melanogaster]|eukprot:NP_001246296.1 centrosomin, isoform H [Drosophila melanogaster]
MNSNRTSSSHNSRNLKILNASFDVPRPPGGGNSPLPSQGRSVRELEEQMSALRKENFNLKLRIYFLEEGQPGARADSSTESLSKQLIDAKIEIATLRKTVDVKMELLKDAARAISHHEELQRKADIDSQAIIDELQEQIHAYQMAESGGQPVENIAKTRKMLRLESEVQRLEEELVNIEARNVAARNELEFMLAERLESLTACEGKIQELAIKNSELVERLEKETASAESSNEAIDSLKVELEACRKENQDLVTSIRTLKHDMKRQVRSMKEAANTMDVQRQSILLLEATIKRKEKSCGSMQKNVLNYEALIAKLNAELETMRQQNVYFRELSENLQQKEVRQLDRGVAIVQPMRMTADAGVGITSSLERSGSTSSLHSNFSSISVLCGSQGPSSHKSLCHWKGSQLQQQATYPCPQYVYHQGHHQTRHTQLMAMTAPSTAFYNYSLPSLTGFRQFLWRWGT